MIRESIIEHDRNYCQHYGRGKGVDMVCARGMNLKEVMGVPVGKMKWGPCIGGHNLEDPTKHCPHWVRRTQEHAEALADTFEASMRQMEIVMPAVDKWRVKPKPSSDRREIIECPECKGKLHLAQSSYNGHVHVHCETEGCVSWME